MNKWQLLRQYQKIADDGLCPPLLHHCGNEFISVLGAGDDPAFYCAHCNVRIALGLATWLDLQRAVDNNDLCGP